MKLDQHMEAFFAKAAKDPRIGISHISLYLTIAALWQGQGAHNPVLSFASTMMKLTKISSSSTYVRLLKDLTNAGFIRFEPCYNKNKPSKIFLNDLR